MTTVVPTRNSSDPIVSQPIPLPLLPTPWDTIPQQTLLVPEERRPGQPINDISNNKFVHVSEIERYVKACVNQIFKPENRVPLITDGLVNNLADHIANVGIRDTEVNQISGSGGPSEPAFQFPEPLAPLQLSTRNPGHSTPIVPSPNHRQTEFGNRFGNEQQPNQSQQYVNPRLMYDGVNQGYMAPRRLPHQQCSIIEKWPKFTGETNTVPVTDFLRQINILCKSYAISKADLRMHAHLLFRDGAYVWYTTYEEKFVSWEALEMYLKMRYDNPNRDRVILEEMRNRKQRPNELFSAFLTDMEMLAQRMIRKMTEQQKFEVIVENMKISYKRRLALETIYSTDHLAQLCYRFDALETPLYHPYSQPKRVINQIGLEEDAYDEDFQVEEVNAVASKQTNRFPNAAMKYSERKQEPTNESTESICWNCRKRGHSWRNCSEEKKIFCHVCGFLGRVVSKCPNRHDLGEVQSLLAKNDSEEEA